DGTTSTMFDTGPFHNTGLFKRTTSTTITSVTSAFDNDGTVDVQTGGLILGGGGGASPSTGSFDATGTLLRFSQGTYDLAPSSSVTGTHVEFGFATVNHAGTYNVTGSTDIAGGQVHFTGTVTNVGAALDISAGTADFSSGETIAPTTLTMTGGTLTGPGPVPVGRLTTPAAGIMDGAGTTNCNGGIAFGTNGQKGVSRTVNSPGTATWTTGDIRLYAAGGVFNNSGTFDAQADGTASVMFDTGGFHNTGTLK